MTGGFESVSAANIAQALASDYFSIYYVNTENDRFIEYRYGQLCGIQRHGGVR